MQPRASSWRDSEASEWLAYPSPAGARTQEESSDGPASASSDVNNGLRTSDASALANRLEQNRLRGDVVDRLALASRRHARHSADRLWAGEHAIGQHVVVFFYREPGPSDAFDLLRVATRMFLAGEDVADLHSVVRQLHVLAREYWDMGRFDPRDQLSTRVESMSPDADYVGLGVATLNPGDVTLDGAVFSDNRPFRGIAALSDGTRLISRWTGGLDSVRSESTHTLNVGTTVTRTWSWAGPDFLHGATEAGQIGSAVLDLHEFILQTHQAAHAAAGQHRRTWQRRR